MPRDDLASEHADLAAAEATRIGGQPSADESTEVQPDEAQRPLAEAGQGKAEGFEQAEQQLIDHASHGDQRAARRAIEEDTP